MSLKIPEYLKVAKRKGQQVLIAAEDLWGGQTIGMYACGHPHPFVHPIILSLGHYMTMSDNPNCYIMEVMVSGGSDWGRLYEPCWFTEIRAGVLDQDGHPYKDWRKPVVIKKGEIIRIPQVNKDDIRF